MHTNGTGMNPETTLPPLPFVARPMDSGLTVILRVIRSAGGLPAPGQGTSRAGEVSSVILPRPRHPDRYTAGFLIPCTPVISIFAKNWYKRVP